jgi:hypothetical protein
MQQDGLVQAPLKAAGQAYNTTSFVIASTPPEERLLSHFQSWTHFSKTVMTRAYEVVIEAK